MRDLGFRVLRDLGFRVLRDLGFKVLRDLGFRVLRGKVDTDNPAWPYPRASKCPIISNLG